MTTPRLSFELFPPKSSEEESHFWQTVEQLHPFASAFISVTNSPRDPHHQKTLHWVKQLHAQNIGPLAVHMTCVGMTRAGLEQLAQSYWDLGIRHIVVIKGAVPKNGPPPATDFDHTKDLIKALKSLADFKIIVGCFPEPREGSIDNDLDHLAVKIEAGADYTISQFCFHTSHIINYRDQIVKRGLPIKLIPGIMPIFDKDKVRTMAQATSAAFPDWLESQLHQDKNAAAKIAITQCQALLKAGFDQFHFFTMNQPQPSHFIARSLLASGDHNKASAR